MANSISEAFIEISPDFGGFAGKLGDGFGLAFGSVASTLADTMESAGKSMMKKFSIPLAVATAANVAQFQALESEINTVLTLFGTAPALIDETWTEMSEGIRDVAEEVGGLEKDIAGGLYQAISAGVPKDNVFEFLEVAQMAAMADKAADLTTAVDGISTAVNAFSAENLTAAKASDILFAGVAAGKTTFGELGGSIGRAAGLAANAGVKFSEFIATIAEMTKSGVATGEAVSYMRAAITSLLRPSEEMNAIFQGIGFATAEAAVPVIGLQASLQTLVDATGGSTSKLQELLGSAEAVTTVLSITGEKADSFSRTLGTMESSAGSTERAYDIMQRGIGRSFGRLTESFDRLGNLFGEMGSKLVKPFVDLMGNLVSGLVRVFEGLRPMAETVGIALEKMMSFFDIPLVGAFTEGILALALGLSALLGVIGPIIFGIAKLIKVFVLAQVFGNLKNVMDALISTFLIFRFKMMETIVTGKIFTGVMGAMQVALKGLITTFGSTAVALTVVFVAILAASAVIFGLVKAFTAVRKASEEAAKQNDIFGDGVSRLMENAGIAENAMPKVFEATTVAVDATRTANYRLIKELELTKAAVGALAAGDVLVNIATSMVWKGATPEEAFDEIRKIAAATGIEFPMTFVDFEASIQSVESSFAGLNVLADEMRVTLDALPDTMNAWDVLDDLDIKKLADGLAETLVIAKETGELGLFEDMMSGLEATIDDSVVFSELLEHIFYGLEDINGEELGISTTKGQASLEAFFAELQNIGRLPDELKDIDLSVGIDTDLVKDTGIEESFAAITKYVPATEGVIVLLDGQVEKVHELADGIDAVFQAALDSIDTTNAEIIASIESQIPVFAEYTAAVATSAASIKSSSEAWAGDLKVVADGTATLGDHLTPAEIVIFNDQSIAEQASWFKGVNEQLIIDAETGTAGVEEMYSGLQTLMQTGAVGPAKILSEAQTTMDTAKEALNTAITDMLVSASEGGDEIPAAFSSRFNAGLVPIGVATTEWMNLLKEEMGADISGPTITAPTFIGGQTTYTINVSASNSPSPGKDVSRALQYANQFNR